MKTASYQSYEEADVLVVGGGPAGLAAAVASARNGAKTILVERYGFLGGMATAGLVNPFTDFYVGDKQLVKGVFEEIRKQLEGYGAWGGYGHRNAFDPEVLKCVADDLCLESGVRLAFHSLASDAIVVDNSIRGVVVETKSGKLTIAAKRVIDATGDGDVCARAGVPYEIGRSQDGLTQPMTTFFQIGNVDMERLMRANQEDYRFANAMKEAKAQGELNVPRENILFFALPRKSELGINTTRIVGLDATSYDGLTQAELIGRKQIRELMNFLRKRVPGCEESCLIRIATQVGPRESRRIVGEYTMDKADIVEARKFSDGICYCSYPIDIHNPTGEGTIIEEPPVGEYYEIPYRCLIPKEIDNLLVAGRCISCTHEAQAAIRTMPTCFAMGQAAGVAAAMSLSSDVTPRDLNGEILRGELEKQGAF